MKYYGSVYRPPSEANSLIIQVTLGCTHNSCTFCPMYSDKRFRMVPFDEVLACLKEARCEFPYVRRVFFADGNSLCLTNEKLLPLMEATKAIFPECERISVYARAENVLRKTDQELLALKAAGLGIVYIGAESGSDQVLLRVNKGETATQMIEAVQRAEALGIKTSVTFISGLGGKELMEEHAIKTGEMITQMGASYVGLLTLMTAPGTPLFNDLTSGRFELLSQREIVRELELILTHSHCEKPSVIRSNHASNRLVLAGTLPNDKERLLAQVRAAQTSEEGLRAKGFRGF